MSLGSADYAVEVVYDESFPAREEAVETVIDRLEECVNPDQIAHGAGS